MSIPNLTSLDTHPRRKLTPAAVDGVYCLDSLDDISKCDSSVIIIRKALKLTPEQTQKLDAFMSDDAKVPPTPNPRNSNTNLKRKQVTFGASYNFGQKSPSILTPVEEWPEAVQKALEYGKRVAVEKKINPGLYNGVHANLYPDGAVGVAAHSDSEVDLVKGLPILSFTLLSGDMKPRPFTIYQPQTDTERKQQLGVWKEEVEGAEMVGKKGPPKPPPLLTPIANVVLGHGDLLIMQGMMQDSFKHGIEPAKPQKDFKNARRLNLTVRAFNPEATEQSSKKPKNK